MKRAMLLSIVGMDVTRFNLLRQRKQLPFTGKAESEGGWQDFSLQDAFKLRMMKNLMDGFGLGPQEAKSILHGCVIDVHAAAEASPDWWIGESGTPSGYFTQHVGTLAQLAADIEARDCDMRVFLVNASRAAREVLFSASDMGAVD